MNDQTEKTTSTEQNIARHTYAMGRYINVTGVIDPHESVALAVVNVEILRGWRQIISDELYQRDPTWIALLMPPWGESSAVAYREIVTTLDAATLGELATLLLGEVQRRGIVLAGDLAEPDIAESALQRTVRHLIRTEPQEAMAAFRSLELFCGSVRVQMEKMLAAADPSDRMRRVDASLADRRAADAALADAPEPPPSAAPKVSPEPLPAIPWQSLRVWVSAMPNVGQKQDEVTNTIDRWRWLHLLQAEGPSALFRCGLFVTSGSDVLAEQQLQGDADADIDWTLQEDADADIDWTGFPTEPGQL